MATMETRPVVAEAPLATPVIRTLPAPPISRPSAAPTSLEIEAALDRFERTWGPVRQWMAWEIEAALALTITGPAPIFWCLPAWVIGLIGART